ncbi:MAG: PorP/SprF family type IX secretion system membrane protein [Bacteroidetes bacterium]|nr:PorP/SprF family type IX secretion system membrane protein [Bacteroidota bacterium]
MKKNLYISLFLLSMIVFSKYSIAQQLPIYTNYILNPYAYNPAVAGSKPNAVMNLNYRNQWVGFQDAPKTYMISLHSPIGKQKKVAIGALVNSDNVGLLSRTSGYLSFAYHIKLNKSGVATYQYIGNKISWKDSQSNLSQHMYATLGYTFKISKTISIQPSALAKFNAPLPIQPEFSLRALYKNLFWIGGSYRMNDAASALIGVTIKDKLTIGYSYDIVTSNIKSYTKGSHEIAVCYQFIKPKKKLDADEQELNDIDNSIKTKLKKQNEEGTK